MKTIDKTDLYKFIMDTLSTYNLTEESIDYKIGQLDIMIKLQTFIVNYKKYDN